jgi:hypothetical protein
MQFGQSHPYQLDPDVIDRECLRLIQIIYSSQILQARSIDLLKQAKGKGLEKFAAPGSLQTLANREESEASRILLNLAITLRSLLDRRPLDDLEDVECSDLVECTVPLTESLRKWMVRPIPQIWAATLNTGATTQRIGLRESSNKIIHAAAVMWERDKIPDYTPPRDLDIGQFLTGKVWLCGDRESRKGTTVWVCKLDVEWYCLHAHAQL